MNKINFQNGTLVAKAKVTINGTVYEVEPAEYEGTTPLNAENLNQIQTNAENAINTVQSNLNTTDQNIENLTTYSTTEKIVGTWIDGKPIYECVLNVGSISAGSVGHVPFSRTNIDEILDCEGFGRDSSNNWFLLSRAHPDYFKYQISIYYNYPDNEFSIEMGTEISITTGYIIVRYTKTTD